MSFRTVWGLHLTFFKEAIENRKTTNIYMDGDVNETTTLESYKLKSGAIMLMNKHAGQTLLCF